MKYLSRVKYEELKTLYSVAIADSILMEGFSNIKQLVGQIIENVIIELERVNKKKK